VKTVAPPPPPKAWQPLSPKDITVNTDDGTNGIGYSKTDGRFYVRDFTLKPGVVMTVEGSKPFIVMAARNISLEGSIVANGGDAAQRPKYEYNPQFGPNKWYLMHDYGTYTSYAPGPIRGMGGPGGGEGGKGTPWTTKTQQYYNPYGYYSSYSSMPDATDGFGWDATATGKGGGGGGKVSSKPVAGYTSSYYTTYYYAYAGAGGGGSSVTSGKGGYTYYSSQYGGGTSASASSDKLDLDSLSPSTMYGGGGGGGGGPGGFYYSTYSYYYGYSNGAGGGGGGGAVAMVAKGDLLLSGSIDVHGGVGGGYGYYYAYMGGGGGGGAGGNVLLHSDGEFKFGLPVLNAGGGVGGYTHYYTYTQYSHWSVGGDGGTGGILLTGKTAPSLPSISLDPSKLILGVGGALGSTSISLSDSAVSTWQDGGTIVPIYTGLSYSGSGVASLLVQGAQTDPIAGSADETNTTLWQDASTLSKLDGYRWYRFKVVLTGVTKSYPSVDSVTVTWSYAK
jgi:hypothetical protein